MAGPYFSVAIARDAPVGVIVGAFSARHSRMFLWDTDSDIVTPGQFVKARARVQDVSPDGKYVAYYAEAYATPAQTFVAVSRPPHFSALAFVPSHPMLGMDAYFRDPNQLVVTSTEWSPEWIANFDRVKERFEPNCPLEVRYALETRAEIAAFNRLADPTPPASHAVLVRDPRHSRVAFVRDQALFVRTPGGGEEKIADLRREPFEAISPPEWATRW